MIFTITIIIMFGTPLILKEKENQPTAKVEPTPCTVQIKVKGQQQSYELENYIERVVAAEMPSTFHIEALKAQAVAARTYALKTTNFGKTEILPTTAHQAFSKEQSIPPIVKQAVKETTSEVLIFNNELISAMFFSTSNGQTESAFSYSGFEIPYLQSTDSKQDEQSPKFNQQKTFTLQQWNEIFGFNWTEKQFQQMQLERNESNRVQKMIAGQYAWSGREIREKLQLPSTDFQIVNGQHEITVITKGYGHGVGMSQYGANGMAQNNSTYEEILQHYYPGTTKENFQKLSSACLKFSSLANNEN